MTHTYDGRGAPFHIREIVGDDFALTITCQTSSGDPIDVSAYVIDAVVHQGLTGEDVSFTVDVSGDDNNIITISLTDEDTEDLGAGQFRWSLSATLGGHTDQWLSGLFSLSRPGTPGRPPTANALTVTVSPAITVVIQETVGSGGASETNLAWDAATSEVTSDTGTAATLTAVDGTNPGLMTVAQKAKLDGIEAAATADQTAAEILAALLTVDGSDSGLDADLLDGVSSAGFQAAGAAAGGVLAGTYPNPSFAADMATQAELDAHINDTAAAHPASAVAFTPAGTVAATDAQAAIEEVAADAAAALATHASADVLKADFDANTILKADADNTPTALTVAEQRLVGRITAGVITALTAAEVRTLINVENGATADQTAAEILAALLTVDGTGSGLDADLLDGVSSAGFDTAGAAAAAQAASQPLDSDLTAIAALAPSNDDVVQRKTGAWTNRTIAQLLVDLAAPGTTFQPLDSDLTAVAALAPSNDDVVQRKAGAWANRTIAQLLSDLAAAGTTFQPLDSDLTSIAALTTTTYGRALLTLANAAAADWVTKALYDANSILAATSDDTPVALTIAASRVVGRKSSGDISAMTGAETAAILAGEVFKQAQEVNAQTGTSYTLVAGDAGKLVSLSNASAIALTLPQDSDATIAVGTYVDLYQLGAGQVTVAAGTGATLRTSGLTAKARAQYSRLGVQKVSANTWSLFGDLAAS